MGPKIWVQYEEAVEAHIVYPHWWASTRSMVWNMCFCEGKMKDREVREQEKSVDYLSPGSRSATQSIMASMRSVGMVGKDMVRSSSHTFTIMFTWV